MQTQQDYFVNTATNLAARINSAWETEESLKALFESYFKGLPFDRTDHWNVILFRLVTEAWHESGPATKTTPTQTDINKILFELGMKLDFNLFSQVALNLQTYNGFAYQTGAAEKELEALRDKYAGLKDASGHALPSPLEAKAKMKIAATNVEAEYNADLSAIKALRIVAGFGPQASWRVTPKGSTPAFADSKNISMIGLGGDRYLKTLPNIQVYYLMWNETPNLLHARTDGGFDVAGVPYPFFSKSGGQILNETLFARAIMWRVYQVIDTTIKALTVIPRMNSVMVITHHAPELEEMSSQLGLKVFKGERPQDAVLSQS